MRTARFLRTIAVALAAAAAACGPQPGAPTPEAANPAPGPARRIVTLSPHLAELAYDAGAGDRLVGVVEFSDFPPDGEGPAASRRRLPGGLRGRRGAQARPGPRLDLGQSRRKPSGGCAISAIAS